MNKKASAIVEIFIILVVIVLTSALVLFLVKTGILTIKNQANQPPILNTEFIPYAREGTLTISEFAFCSYANEQYQCLDPKNHFTIGEDAYFRYIIKTTPYNGDILLIENYRILSSTGKVMLDIDKKNNYHYDIISQEPTESISFKDYFTIGKGIPSGTYSIELLIENPLLNKKTTLTQTFVVE